MEMAEQGVSVRKTSLAEVDREVGDEGEGPVVFGESDRAQPGWMDECGEVAEIQSSSGG